MKWREEQPDRLLPESPYGCFFSLFFPSYLSRASTNGVIRQNNGKRRESNANRRLGEYIFRAGNATRDDESAVKNDRGSEVFETLVGQDQRKFLIKAGSESLGHFAKVNSDPPRERHLNLSDVELLTRDPQGRPHRSQGHPPLIQAVPNPQSTCYVLIVVPEIPANSSPIEEEK